MAFNLTIRSLFAALLCFGIVLAFGPPAAMAEQGANVRSDAHAADEGVIAVVYVGTSAGKQCEGQVRHAGRAAQLPPLRTDRTGGGRWRWKIAHGVPPGVWKVKVSCHLGGETVTTKSGFPASGYRHADRTPSRLVAAGTMRAEPWHDKSKTGGHGGEGEDGYPKGQCTWWVRQKRPDIPVFKGPAGDAKNWGDSARRADPPFRVGTKAKPGAVAVFQPGQAEAGEFGHVAYVESVHGAQMTISEANFPGTKPGHRRTLRWRGQHFEFIYAKATNHKKSGPPPANAFRFKVFRTCINGHCGLKRREGPGLSFPLTGAFLPDGTAVDVVCQTRGDRVVGYDASSTDVWDRLVDGSYVSDYFVETPGKNDQFTVPIPNCAQATVPQEPPPPPVVTLTAPTAGTTLTGVVQVAATSNAPAVEFEVFYATTGVPGTATWHPLGVDASPADGFGLSWNTAEVPNQGLGTQPTIKLLARALSPQGLPEDVRQVAVANPNPNGTFTYHVFGTCDLDCKLKRRSGPGFSEYPPVGTTDELAPVDVVCQAHGEVVSGTDVWNEFSDGSWGSDFYVDTPGFGTFSPPIPECGSVPPPPTLKVSLTAPASGSTVTGTVAIEASSNAPGVRFEAFYSPEPGTATATWHLLGEDKVPGDGFTYSWDTTSVPNQGQPIQETVRVRATALNYREAPTMVQATRRVSVSNVSPDGTYHYHVFGTCKESDCTVNLRSGPGNMGYSIVGTKEEGDELDIACQAHGEEVTIGKSTDVWDRLKDGSWITDYYVDTPVAGAFSPPIPVCE